MTEYSHQDWKPVTLNRLYTPTEKLKNAQRSGQTTSVSRNPLQNKSAKLDSETEKSFIELFVLVDQIYNCLAYLYLPIRFLV